MKKLKEQGYIPSEAAPVAPFEVDECEEFKGEPGDKQCSDDDDDFAQP